MVTFEDLDLDLLDDFDWDALLDTADLFDLLVETA